MVEGGDDAYYLVLADRAGGGVAGRSNHEGWGLRAARRPRGRYHRGLARRFSVRHARHACGRPGGELGDGDDRRNRLALVVAFHQAVEASRRRY